MADKTLTAPLAIIETGGNAVGKIKTIRITENIQRGDVRGLGTLISKEKPVLGITCSFTASSYFIDLTKFGTVDNPFIKRKVAGSLMNFLDTLLLTDTLVNIHLYRKIEFSRDPTTGIVTSTSKEPIGILTGVFMDSQSFDISEGQISGTDMTGTYLEPIIS